MSQQLKIGDSVNGNTVILAAPIKDEDDDSHMAVALLTPECIVQVGEVRKQDNKKEPYTFELDTQFPSTMSPSIAKTFAKKIRWK